MAAKRWMLAHGRHLDLGGKALVMGVLNVTPDSFSDGGRFDTVENALAQARRMVGEGAASSMSAASRRGPAPKPVTALEEQRRVLPVIEALAAERSCLISVDTYREETARLAVAAGAHIVNDVWGLQREPDIARLAAEDRRRAGHHAHRARAREAAGRDRRPVRLPRPLAGDRRSVRRPSRPDRARSGFRLRQGGRRKTSRLMARFDELHALRPAADWSARRASASSATSPGAMPTRGTRARRRPASSCGSRAPRCFASTMSQSTWMRWPSRMLCSSAKNQRLKADRHVSHPHEELRLLRAPWRARRGGDARPALLCRRRSDASILAARSMTIPSTTPSTTASPSR